MNRRSFLAALAAPLLVRPTLEEIERLGWRRRFFPGWSPLNVGDVLTIAGFYEVNPISRLSTGKLRQFVATSSGFKPRVGDTIHVRRPQRFQISE